VCPTRIHHLRDLRDVFEPYINLSAMVLKMFFFFCWQKDWDRSNSSRTWNKAINEFTNGRWRLPPTGKNLLSSHVKSNETFMFFSHQCISLIHQQEITGVFMRNCTLNYSSYRNIFPIWVLGKYRRRVFTQRNQMLSSST